MRIVKFKEANKTLKPPKGPTPCKVVDLPVFSDGEYCISCWRPGIWEIIKLFFTRRIWLSVLSGATSPPVMVSIQYPFLKPGQK